MKAQFKVRPNLIIEVEEDKQVNLFKSLASIQEVFGENKCGKCGGTDIRFTVRQVDKSKFLELKCNLCYSKLAISPHDSDAGTLYPNRTKKDEAGERQYLPNNGWVKWNKEKECLE
jgi:hypothetical protein